jgi:DNA-binding response OmpR family regulator
VIETRLSIDGFDVAVHPDGNSGLAAALELLPDVLLLDIALPGINGWEVLRRLRADTGGRAVPVIVITAHDVAESSVTPIAGEADRVFGKPFDLQRVRKAVATLAQDGRSRAA